MSVNFSRRDFFKSAAISAAAGTLLNDCSQTSVEPPALKGTLRLGTVTYNFGKDWDIETLIKNCTETKFEAVELRTTHAHKVEVDLTPSQRQEVKKKFEDSPVELHSMGSAFEYQSDDPAEVRKNIEGTKEYTILARDVGAVGVKVRPNGLQLNKGIPEEQTLEQIGKSVGECAGFAKDYGIAIRVECHGRDTASLPRMKKIMDYADNDNAYACWNCNPQDLMDDGFDANLELMISKIDLVHMHELSNVEYPFRKLFKRLKEYGYKGYCLAEAAQSKEPIRLMNYYRALFLAYQDVV